MNIKCLSLMKKNKYLLAGSAVLAFLAAVGGYRAYTSNCANECSGLLMENVEALAYDENTKCTRAIRTEPCYEDVFMGYYPNSTRPIIVKMQTHVRISDIEEYEVKSAAEVCLHDAITDC